MITSASNPRLKRLRRAQTRRGRAQLGLFPCEGEDLVVAALEAGLEPVDLLVDAERPPALPSLPAGEEVEPALLAEVCELAHPPRVVALFRSADLPRLDPSASPPVGLALWRVADPGNVGTLLRAADAFGPAFVCLSAGCADPLGLKAVRASAGAIFRVPLGDFAAAPSPRIALVVHGGPPLAELRLPEPVTFVLGAERDGLPADLVAGCDGTATIPQAPAAESLNVAMAGTVALYERARQNGRRADHTESSPPR